MDTWMFRMTTAGFVAGVTCVVNGTSSRYTKIYVPHDRVTGRASVAVFVFVVVLVVGCCWALELVSRVRDL